jgi:L,D-peptidoglycan transpeptidase YkuD (ErfK/YbiS/YcfS/YnhG family)
MIPRTLLLLASLFLPVTAFELPADSTQCLVGIADTWDSSTATLCLYQKSSGKWQAAGPTWQARLGKNGLIWGKGLHPQPTQSATKKEGDNRSPAGVFAIGGAWGAAHKIQKSPSLAYRQVTTRDLWVEDPTSPSYNKHIVLDHEPTTAWEKKQQMKQNDPVHALKLFIAHNPPPAATPGAGSAIFFHIWRNDGAKATAGCTTMDVKKLQSLIAKIDPARRPLYVLLPRADYEKLRSHWKLP